MLKVGILQVLPGLGPVALKVWRIIIPFNDPDTDKRDQLNFAGMVE